MCTFALQAILDDAGVGVVFADAGYPGAFGSRAGAVHAR